MKVFEDVKKALTLGQYKLGYVGITVSLGQVFTTLNIFMCMQERNILSKSSVKYIVFLTTRMNQDTY